MDKEIYDSLKYLATRSKKRNDKNGHDLKERLKKLSIKLKLGDPRIAKKLASLENAGGEDGQVL